MHLSSFLCAITQRFSVTCYLEVINFLNYHGNSALRCVSTCFYIATSFAECPPTMDIARVSRLLSSPFLSTLIPPFHISLFYSDSLSLFHIYLNKFFFNHPLASNIRLSDDKGARILRHGLIFMRITYCAGEPQIVDRTNGECRFHR